MLMNASTVILRGSPTLVRRLPSLSRPHALMTEPFSLINRPPSLLTNHKPTGRPRHLSRAGQGREPAPGARRRLRRPLPLQPAALPPHRHARGFSPFDPGEQQREVKRRCAHARMTDRHFLPARQQDEITPDHPSNDKHNRRASPSAASNASSSAPSAPAAAPSLPPAPSMRLPLHARLQGEVLGTPIFVHLRRLLLTMAVMMVGRYARRCCPHPGRRRRRGMQGQERRRRC